MWDDVFRTRPDRPWGLLSIHMQYVLGLYQRPERGLDHPRYSRAKFKKGNCYNSTPTLGFVAFSRENIIFLYLPEILLLQLNH